MKQNVGPSDLSSHTGDAMRRDVPTQDVTPQVWILLVLEVGDAASQARFVFNVCGLELLEDLWARRAVKDKNSNTFMYRVYRTNTFIHLLK